MQTYPKIKKIATFIETEYQKIVADVPTFSKFTEEDSRQGDLLPRTEDIFTYTIGDVNAYMG